ncbi:hypothetical protein GBAR_LOCUS25749 [Geodia barretti]|uniref:Copper acquisition factor BIM1-like domain-containing protein n=1 Tax=Geodia barretti TaxID=519541 RepID=A0AA35XCL9_GEOBA|nr:hypothetical protein GBAR_LOCUS25749 [Geodia barretti]
MKAVVVIVATLAMAAAHICMVSPRQRGTLQGLDKPGAADCIRLSPEPCGGQKSDGNTAIFKPGVNVSIIFQKNLNHWDQSTPGSFNIAIGDSEEKNFKTILSVKDTNSSSLTYYYPNITIPMEETKHAVMQLTYVTKNPKAPAVFYQCADFAITRE